MVYDGEMIKKTGCKHRWKVTDFHDADWDYVYVRCKKCGKEKLIEIESNKEFYSQVLSLAKKDLNVLNKLSKGNK